MLWRLVLAIAVVAAILIALGYDRTPTRETVLAKAGPVDADAPEEFTTSTTGLKYRILREGEGEKPKPADTISAHYAGWLESGEQFDTSYGSQPMEMPLKGLIPGWTQGLQLVREGGMIELEIPGELGYGKWGLGDKIPPNATLHFIVELIEVQAGPEPLEMGPRDPDAPEEFTTTESGLKYRILRKGEGPKPDRNDNVTVHYKGWLDDGTVFDSSYERHETTSFPLDRVIPGWTEGLTYVGEGGMIELIIPGELGYGEKGARGIPPNATLQFIVELKKVREI